MTGSSFGGGSGTALDQMPEPPSAAFLGYELLSVDRAAQRIRVGFRATPAMFNPRGAVQGGFVAAMLDDAMGSMVVILSDGRDAPLSVDLHAQYLRPVAAGPLVCEAELVHRTKSTAFTRAALYDEKGALLATAVQTARLVAMTG